MNPTSFQRPQSLLAAAALALATFTGTAKAETIDILSEDWQDDGWVGTDINVAPNDALSELVGYGLNNNNPTTLLGAGTGGNVLRDQGGFGGTYGSGDNLGNAVRVRSSNGAMLNKTPLKLVTLGATSVTFSFDLKQLTVNYVQVVEYSTDQAFTAPILLDTIDGNTNLGLWIAKSYTLVHGVDTTFTDDFYFRIRKLRPSPAGTNGGANSTFHAYDNLKVSIEAGPAPPFTITDIVYDPSAHTVRLTWTSRANTSYIAKASRSMTHVPNSLEGWSTDIGDSLTAAMDENPNDGDLITVTFNLATLGLQNEMSLFFRIEEQ